MKNTKRQALAHRIREQRAQRRAAKALATGTPQTARTHLIAAGIDDPTARRYAGAFSRGTTPTAIGETAIKLKGRTRKAITIKLYSQRSFAARLSTYRPKDPAAAKVFDRLALAA